MRAWVLAGVVGAGCGTPDNTPIDAAMDGAIDAAIDADEGTGYRVTGTAEGIRNPITLILASGGVPDQTIAVTEDGAFRFPRRLASGASFTVTASGSQACLPVAGGTINVADAQVALICDGVTELRKVTFSSHAHLIPSFDPRATMYVGFEPRLVDATDSIVVTGMPFYSSATCAPVTSLPDTLIQLDVSRSTLMRSYRFDLSRVLRPEGYIKSPTPTDVDFFGGGGTSMYGDRSIAISGDTLVVGEPAHNKVFVYTRTWETWSWQATLQGSAMGPFGFGVAVAIEGDTLVIGTSPQNLSAPAAVFVFTRTGTTWSAPTALDPSLGGTADNHFGIAVAISGNYIAATAPGQNKVFLFQNTGTWGLVKTITGSTSGSFGVAVALSGSTLAVGDPDNTSSKGAVFVYYGANWMSMTTFTGATNLDKLGAAVSLDGDLLAAGAPGEDVAGKADAGAVHLYRFTTSWASETTLSSGTPVASDAFGTAVAVDRGHVIVGAPNEDCAGRGIQVACGGTATDAGAVYLFRKPAASWIQDRYVKAVNADPLDQFGMGVAIDNDTFVAAAPNERSLSVTDPMNNAATFVGAAYVFR